MRFQVDTHTHTYASGHAYSTLLENVQFAKKNGLKILCTTDHASSMPGAPHYWFFNNQKVLPRLIDGVGIIRGMEANILPQGMLDIHPSSDRLLDWVNASFHEAVYPPQTKAQHTQDLLQVIQSNRIDALGHLGNPNYDFDFEVVIEAAKQHHVAIEINHSSLLGNSRPGSDIRCEKIALMAKEIGAKITTGSDAHFCQDIGRFEQIDKLLTKIKMPTEQIITYTPEAFLAFLASRKRHPIAEFAIFK